MIRLAVFGSPISHSRSPAIHARFADQFGLEVDYRAIEATFDDFSGKVRQLAAAGGLGCNITVPFKSEAWKLANRHSPSAARAGVANTLVFDRADDWYGDNTDGRGLVIDIQQRLGFRIRSSRICIIGAGGASAGIIGDFLEHQPAALTIANRTLQKARDLAESSGPGIEAIPLEDLANTDSFDLVINSTSMGHSGSGLQLPGNLFNPQTLFYDLNYGPAADPTREFCLEAGIRHSDGLGMLVEQAALSFELWTGKQPDTDPVLDSLRSET